MLFLSDILEKRRVPRSQSHLPTSGCTSALLNTHGKSALVQLYLNTLICRYAHKVISSSAPLPLIPKFSTPTTSLCAWGRAGLLTGVRTYQSAFVCEPRQHVLLSWPLWPDNSVQRRTRERASDRVRGVDVPTLRAPSLPV